MSVPKLMPVLDQKLELALDLKVKNEDNENYEMALVHLHGIIAIFEQVTRLIEIREIGFIGKLMSCL